VSRLVSRLVSRSFFEFSRLWDRMCRLKLLLLIYL